MGGSDETNMSHVPHPPSETFLRPWLTNLRPRPKMAPPLGGCRDGSGAIGPTPGGGSDETNMSHVPHPPSGTFLRPWLTPLRPRPKMAPTRGCRDGSRAIGPPPGGAVMKPTCHIFLIHLVEHFCTLG